MKSEHDELNKVVDDLKNGRTATPVTIRTFLSWFGAQRRTASNVEYINDQLQRCNVKTVPDYLDIWVDTPITFELVSKKTGKNSKDENIEIDNDQPEEVVAGKFPEDPSFKIGKLAASHNKPVSVKPNASLMEAVTLLMSHNFSQLPVMTNEREVKGVISWESIGARSVRGVSGPDVQSYMDVHHEISANSSLFSAIKVIIENNYVLIRSSDRTISGIVTSNDISMQFEEISTPFLLLAEIENNLRSLLSSKLDQDDIKNACSEEYLPANWSGSVADLTFGNYVRILQNENNWEKVKINLDRTVFCLQLSEVNRIRNDVMHFDPDPLTISDLSKLRNVSKMFDLLREIGVF